MSTKAKAIGDRGEQAALKMLLDKGYELNVRNYRSPHGEIDIIVRNDDCIVFVEVKTRNSRSLSRPSEAVTPHKQRCMILTAMQYLSENPTDLQPRFDVIEVVYSTDKRFVSEMNHIENAFYQSEEYAVF